MDCLLDIVTEPDNQGLKVYSHKVREERIELPELSEKLIMVRMKVHNDDNFAYYSYSCSYTRKYYEANLEKFEDYEEVDYEWAKNDYILKYYDVQYWVEAFMQ